MSMRCAVMVLAMAMAGVVVQGQTIDLSTSKQLLGRVPGDPRRVNSLPMSLAVSPDGKWVVSLNAGYGTFESGYAQSLAVMNVATGVVKDFPDDRVGPNSAQTFFSGLAFDRTGRRLYVSLASTSAPEGKAEDATGNGIAVYEFADGVLKPHTFIKLPLVRLAEGRHTDYAASPVGRREVAEQAVSKGADVNGAMGVPYPAAIALFEPSCMGTACAEQHPHLLVAENLSDSVAEVDATTSAIVHTYDLSSAEAVPSTYPIAVAVTKDGKRAFVALWNASEVVELDLEKQAVTRRVALLKPESPIAPGTHPDALLLDEKDGVLYVALSNKDAVAAVEIGKKTPELAVRGYFSTRLPGQSYFGAEPDALAMNAEGTRLYVANLGSDAVAVLDPKKLRSAAKAKGMVEPMGFVPTELMPTAMVAAGGKLYVSSAKAKGTGPNNFAQKQVEPVKGRRGRAGAFTYAPTLLYGSLASIDEASIELGLADSTQVVLESNRMKAAAETIQFAGGGASPIKHVIYIIKENRTYDQILGDLVKDGKKVGNGDASLTMYGEAVTPNEHELALQFGVLDNFYDSAEVSADGHVWSNAGIGTDYLEATWQQNYSRHQRTYDYEGVVADGVPLVQKIPDVEEPASSYIWTDMAAHGRTTYNFGEYIQSTFCDQKKARNSAADARQGAMTGGETTCANPFIKPGEAMPEEWGGGKNLWPWAIPRLAGNVATKPELVGHFAAETPDFNLRIPDQVRAQIMMLHLEQWKKDRAAGHDTMPNFVEMRLGNDHTAGTTPGGPTPKSSVADNDLAIGRMVEAISHSEYWNDTAFFILEDDAQNGGDHVDAHRSIALVISKYSPHPKEGQEAYVDSRFYSTVSVLRTMETLLGVPPMNNNDAFASMISTLFTGAGDQAPYTADMSNKENGLIYAANKASAPGAAASMKMDFTHEDRVDSDKLNLILWQDAMGNVPPPAMLLEKHAKKKDADDDE